MQVKILASGSGGNCISIQSGGVSILVDIGLPKTKVEKRLIEEGIDPTKINAILITHAHGDHTSGLPLANKYQIPVYASEGEWKDLESKVDDDLQFVVSDGRHFPIHGGSDWLDVTPFGTHHDAYGPLGYAVMDREQKASICLDTGKVTPEMLQYMADSDIYIIEANHDPDMLAESSYPDSVKARILSDIGHLSNDQTAVALAQLVKGKGERIFLTHLSKSNNWPALAESTVKRALLQKGLQAGKHFHLEVV